MTKKKKLILELIILITIIISIVVIIFVYQELNSVTPKESTSNEITNYSENKYVKIEKKLDDIIRQGEIEGLTFDTERNQLLVLYNRGARIILGMPSGFYSGYDHEIHEVYTYNINK